ncbi:hypothetical protein RNJ44_03987 [Nakaseomyces bracarensis]|uniref:Uncharacterized protein n=1 Tax=Nakaseomyces bracarensis TaxID=273131 RepID=A0ABR4NTS4_9SACH
MYYPQDHFKNTGPFLADRRLYSRRCKSTSSLTSCGFCSLSKARRQSFNISEKREEFEAGFKENSSYSAHTYNRRRSIKRNKPHKESTDNINTAAIDKKLFTTKITPSLNSVLSQIKNSSSLTSKPSVDLLSSLNSNEKLLQSKLSGTSNTSSNLAAPNSAKRRLSDEIYPTISDVIETPLRTASPVHEDNEDEIYGIDTSMSSIHIHPLAEDFQDSNENELMTNILSHNSIPSNNEVLIDDKKPRLKLINIDDIDLNDEWKVNDIVEVIAPVYHRSYGYIKRYSDTIGNGISDSISIKHKVEKDGRRNSVDLSFSGLKPAELSNADVNRGYKLASNMIYEKDSVELESWPERGSLSPPTAAQEFPSQENPDPTNKLLLPSKRTRTTCLNSNFLRLYSIKTSATYKNLIPEVNVDETVLQQLSYKDIWNLDIHESDVTPNEIKIALITKKKLWSDLLHETRQDLFGESSPWNMKFVVQESASNEAVTDASANNNKRRISLVRMHSEVKPWATEDDFNSEKSGIRMLKPCGKLKLGPRQKEIQYVVKGWCDSRFQTIR